MKKLETTQHIIIGSLLRVYKKGYGYSILRVVAACEYFLAALSDVDFIEAANESEVVEVYLWVENVTSYEFKLEVIGKIKSEPNIILFRNTKNILKSNERKCLGVQTRLPFKFFIIKTGDMHKSFSSEKVVFHNGFVIWIEDREAIIKSSIALEDEMFLKGHIQIDGIDTEIVGKIASLSKEKNIYNILFTGEDEEDRNRILDYIFKIYRE